MRIKLDCFHILIGILGILLLVGCTSAAVTPTATTEPSPVPDTLPPPTATLTPEPTPTLTATSPPTGTPTGFPSPTPGLPLSAEGPWFIFEARLGYRGVNDLWAMNLDGTGLTRLPIDESERYRFHPDFDPQKGGLVAYVDGGLFDNPTLKLLHLPSGESETITPLTSEATAYPLTPPSDEEGEIDHFQIGRAINDNWPSWSPDGRSLAFVGAMNGISADIYVYSLDTRTITQVTSGPTQVQGLLWSPDGKYILHSGIDCFGTGVGDNADSIWAGRSDGSGSIRLVDYPEDYTGDASLYGWMSNDVVLVSDQQALRDYNLRLINITTGEVQIIWDGTFNSLAVDRATGTFMFSPFPASGPGSELERGLWLYRPDFPLQQVTKELTDGYIRWLSDSGVFLVELDAGVMVIESDGKNPTFISAPRGVDFRHIMEAPGGQTWAWYGDDGLCLGAPSQTPECIFDEKVDWISWTPDGTGLMVAVGEKIYFTSYPDINFQVIVSDLYLGYYGRFIP